SDELEHYTSAIREEYGIEKIFPRTGERRRPKKPVKVVPQELVYTQVHKYREKGKVKKIEQKIIFGTEKKAAKKVRESPCSNSVNTSFVERNNLTLRQQNGRLQRKTLQFSKEKELLVSQMDLFLGVYHFIRHHGGLKKVIGEKRQKITPMMAAGKTDHPWSVEEFFLFNWKHLTR
ncbi:MAG: IS1 family transposase, partial [Candidatus Helarchaeota archaeon]